MCERFRVGMMTENFISDPKLQIRTPCKIFLQTKNMALAKKRFKNHANMISPSKGDDLDGYEFIL